MMKFFAISMTIFALISCSEKTASIDEDIFTSPHVDSDKQIAPDKYPDVDDFDEDSQSQSDFDENSEAEAEAETDSDISTEEPITNRQHKYVGAAEDRAVIDALLGGWFSSDEAGKIIYVAPAIGNGATGDGSSRENPNRDLISVIENATAGTHIYLAPGNYDMNAIRDEFGHDSSHLHTRNDGARGNPIVFATDPELFDLNSGSQAVLDFKFENDPVTSRSTCFYMSRDFWLVENMEMKNILTRGIWLSGFDNVIRNIHFHHLDTSGTNNEAFVMLIASGRETNNVIMDNLMHHVGIIDHVTGEITEKAGSNSGCVYSEQRQNYDSPIYETITEETTYEEVQAGLLPADSHVYIYNNVCHHSTVGYAKKTHGEGPWFFLSNVAYDVETGIRTAGRHTVIRNNIFFPGSGDFELSRGISIARPASNLYRGDVIKGSNMIVRNNTIYGALSGLHLYGGWSSVFSHNLVVGTPEPVHIHRNQYQWYEEEAWPGIRGEWLIADLTEQHPYYEIMPRYLQDLSGVFKKGELVNNCYSVEPIIQTADFTQPENEIAGMTFDTNYSIINETDQNNLFNLSDEIDYTHASDSVHQECGSKMSYGL